jgi:uptake hydrogenase large subunit
MIADGIQLVLRRVGNRVAGVTVSSQRPRDAAMRLFRGREAISVPALVPALFSVCGIAQGIASLRACTRAMAIEREVGFDNAHDVLLLAETAREHLRQILIEWPGWAGAFTGVGVSESGRIPAEFRRALFAESNPFSMDGALRPDRAALEVATRRLGSILDSLVFGMPARDWLAMDAAGFDRWLVEVDTLAARTIAWLQEQELAGLGYDCAPVPLPDMEDSWLLARLGGECGDDFVARPDWEGRCRETGAFVRQLHHPLLEALVNRYGCGLLPRLVARLIEVATIPARISDLCQRLEDAATVMIPQAMSGSAVARADAARGQLVHFVRIDGGTISAYRILAPTEWNFHPYGVAAQGLQRLGDADESLLRRRAGYWIAAIDPCVTYRLELI